ncbi:hypothetical protein [Planococcus sp. ISL-109]|uniref:hypothetical protein n=1 Tax=Planococcus sp. ISL-109 TaxID=2819166 RepID=UPI001BEA985E|nr:hypothetical protein [Planococcus sp. ISL-109]MBT2583407.1 hypothetical protein [Planococcus sp. ISL-109]
MLTLNTRSNLRKETRGLYFDMMAYYKRFSVVHEPEATDMQRMKRNLNRLTPASSTEHLEAIRFLDYFLATHLGQVDPVHEAERMELLSRANCFTARDSRKRRALRKWRREYEDSSEQAV